MIRLYEEEDVEAILEVWYQASLLAHSFLTDAFLAEERVKMREVFLPNSTTWVYEDDGQVVGFLSMVGNEVGGLFVHPAKHRHGVGRALMDKAFSLCDFLELDVFEKNNVGRAFYAKYGFVPIDQYREEQTGEMTIRLRYEGKSGTL